MTDSPDEKSPREWTIYRDFISGCSHAVERNFSGEEESNRTKQDLKFDVIEKSAYDKLAELYKNNLKDVNGVIDQLSTERDEAERQYKLYKRFTDQLTKKVRELEQERLSDSIQELQRASLHREIDLTKFKLTTACEALEFYANGGADGQLEIAWHRGEPRAKMIWDCGERARTALAKIKESET